MTVFFSILFFIIYGHFFLYNLYIFEWRKHVCLVNMDLTFDPSNGRIKTLCCTIKPRPCGDLQVNWLFTLVLYLS